MTACLDHTPLKLLVNTVEEMLASSVASTGTKERLVVIRLKQGSELPSCESIIDHVHSVKQGTMATNMIYSVHQKLIRNSRVIDASISSVISA